jgi:pilus assembly protein CpaB
MSPTWMGRIVTALGMAVAALGLVWMRQQARLAAQAPTPPRLVTVVVPKAPIPAGFVLRPSDFTQAQVPASALPPGAVSSPASLAGAVAREELFPGVPVVSAMVYPSVAQAQLPSQLAPGERAMDLPVTSSSGVGGLLQVGDRVDVVAVLPVPGGSAQSEVLLHNVPVLALVSSSGGTSAPVAASGSATYASVVVAVTPRQAAALALAESQGSVTLVLRSPQDQGGTFLRVTSSQLLTGGGGS